MFLMTSYVADDLMLKQASADCKQFALHTALQATSFVAQPLLLSVSVTAAKAMRLVRHCFDRVGTA
jgi:hypothetical protein